MLHELGECHGRMAAGGVKDIPEDEGPHGREAHLQADQQVAEEHKRSD